MSHVCRALGHRNGFTWFHGLPVRTASPDCRDTARGGARGINVGMYSIHGVYGIGFMMTPRIRET